MADPAAPEQPDNARRARDQLIDATLYDKTKALIDLTLLTSSIHSIVEAGREQVTCKMSFFKPKLSFT